MNKDFWIERWETQNIGFHEKNANALFVKHFQALGLDNGARLFVPLCGMSNDISWLLKQGFQVVGVELSELAIKQLFNNLKIEPKVEDLGELKCYSTKNIDIFVGDFFKLNSKILGKVDAIYDRAALVALPIDMRIAYTKYLLEIANSAKQLLITFSYNQAQMSGPPFSISEEEVQGHYQKKYLPSLLESKNVSFRGEIEASENIWLLSLLND